MTVIEPSQPIELSCTACEAYGLSLCGIARAYAPCSTNHTQIEQIARSVPARRIICRENDLHDAVPIICSGWAASVVMLSDASRQILSFLLPGDLV
jgi:CRP/FNR family transcriptional regulator, anaerobic regulatory protein